MSAKKREAEVQLIKDDVEADGDDDQQNVESGKWKAADSATIAQRRFFLAPHISDISDACFACFER